MATTVNQLHIINPATEAELKLVQRDATVKRGNDVIIGDIYSDTSTEQHLTILVVKRKIELQDISDLQK